MGLTLHDGHAEANLRVVNGDQVKLHKAAASKKTRETTMKELRAVSLETKKIVRKKCRIKNNGHACTRQCT
jgi:hypothetical protein